MMKSGNRNVLFITHPELDINSWMGPLCEHVGKRLDDMAHHDHHDASGGVMPLAGSRIAVEELVLLIPTKRAYR
jgi:hypothetical protein